MSKRTSIIIIFIVFVAIFGGLIFWYFSSSGGKQTTTATSTVGPVSPFGTAPGNRFVNINPVIPKTTTTTGQQQNATSAPAEFLHLYENPVAGTIFFTNKKKQTVLRFIDRATGNAYEYLPASGTGPTRITNTTIAKIEEAVFSPDGANVILRTLDNDTDNISTFSGKLTLPASTTSNVLGEITGINLSPNIREIAINTLGNKILGLYMKKDNGGSFGVTTSLNGSGKKQIFDSSMPFWNILWPKESTVTFTTKANSETEGFLFFLNTSNNSLSKILGNILGLSTITNGDASLVAYSESQDNAFSLKIYDVKKKASKSLSLPTLADKCVWGIKNNKNLYCGVPVNINPDNYPDSWYQGLQSFSDDLWMADSVKQTSALVYQVGSNGNAIDVTNLKISLDDKYLSFIDKNDLSLWILKIPTP